jgi:histidine triad (HIT) family protein
MSACPFCQVAAGAVDADLIAYRTRAVFVLPALKQRERNRGHALVLPVAHVVDLVGASKPLLEDLFEVVARVSAAMPLAFGAVGTTVFQNNSVPGQVLPHLHVHVVPRFLDDGFRMPDPTIATIDRSTRGVQVAALATAIRTLDVQR